MGQISGADRRHPKGRHRPVAPLPAAREKIDCRSRKGRNQAARRRFSPKNEANASAVAKRSRVISAGLTERRKRSSIWSSSCIMAIESSPRLNRSESGMIGSCGSKICSEVSNSITESGVMGAGGMKAESPHPTPRQEHPAGVFWPHPKVAQSHAAATMRPL